MRRTHHALLDWGGIFFTLALSIAAILYFQERYAQRLIQLTLTWATMGLAWNMSSGYAGQLSLGHQVFFGLGAYTSTLLMVLWRIPPWFGLLASLVVGILAAIIIGLSTFRLTGMAFALATLAYPLTMQIVMEYLGYQEVALPPMQEKPWLYWQFPHPQEYSWLFLALLMGSLLLSHWIERSRFGYALRAIRDNEPAAAAAGIDIFRSKMLAYLCSSLPAAALGGLFVHAIALVATPPETFGVLVMVDTLSVVLVGGIGTKWGPLIGAACLIPLGEFLATRWGDTYPGIQRLAFGAALILVVLLARQGIFWKLREAFRATTPGRMPRSRLSTAEPLPTLPVPSRSAGPMASETLLEVDHLCKAFVGLQALLDVTFSVQRGEILGIIGPNGAGKTTLLNVLNGFLVPDRGRILFQGRNLAGLHPGTVCQLGIGRTFQGARPFARLSVLENVMIGAFAQHRSVASARRQARLTLARVGLERHAEFQATALTTLDLRLLELARCLATQPRLVLLDEPLVGLGSDDVAVLMRLLQQVRQQGIAVVIIDHTMPALLRLTDRLMVLDHGEKVAEGPPDMVTRQPQVIAAYLGKRWLAPE